MGLITPKKSIACAKKVDKKILDASLAAVGTRLTTDEDGAQINFAQAVANRLWHIAMFAENDKDSITAARFISERINGKPAVLNEEEKEEIPAIVFRINSKDAKKVEELAQRPDVEEEPRDKVVVDIDGEDMVREY